MYTQTMSSYQLYRNTTLGLTLKDALDEQISCQQITPDLALKVLQQFDRSMAAALSKVKTRYNFKGKLKVYRYCDNVWTCVIEDTTFNDNSHSHDGMASKKVKIVACEAGGR